MPAIELILDFHLSGCRSLKERRGRLRGLRDRFGRAPGVCLFEAPLAHLQQARWHFVAANSDRGIAQQQLDDVLRLVTSTVDAQVQVVARRALEPAEGAASRATDVTTGEPQAEHAASGDADALLDAFFAQPPAAPRRRR
ncbi:MAG: DUF503 family protein [Pseudomonadota bacterium]